MGSRILREGSVGLLILVGLGLFGVLVLWLRGFAFGGNSYRFNIVFEDAAGLEVGATVRYRGVQVGRISQVRAESNGAVVTVEIADPNLVMPKGSLIEANQSGFLGKATIDITPGEPLLAGAKFAKPLNRKCNSEAIICHKDRLEGEIGASFDQLVRSSVRFTKLFADPELFSDIKSLTKNTSDATANIAKAAEELAILEKIAQRELGSVSPTLLRVGRAADELALTAAQINQLVAQNRSTLVRTLNNIEQSSVMLVAIANDLAPVVSQIEQGGLVSNLETLASNAAEASTNLRDLSNTLNSPDNVLDLQQTLDAARVTFQNAQKITSDLDDLTGDTEFRNNLRRLIDGLSGLVSSTQHLHRQAQLAQVLAPMQAANTSRRGPRKTAVSRFRKASPYRISPPKTPRQATSAKTPAPEPIPSATTNPSNEADGTSGEAVEQSKAVQTGSMQPDSGQAELGQAEPGQAEPGQPEARPADAIAAIAELGIYGPPSPELYGPPSPATP